MYAPNPWPVWLRRPGRQALRKNSGGGTDTLLLTAATTALVDADFTNFRTVETLQLTGANTIVLGSAAAAAGITTIVLGNESTSITLTDGVSMTIDASALPDGQTLTIAGNGSYTITGLSADLDASASTGAVTVTTAVSSGNLTITTGSAATTVTATTAGDVATVNAEALADGTLLTTSGAGSFTITNFLGNLTNSATGTVAVTLDDDASADPVNTTITNEADSGTFTVNNGSFADGDTINLAGDGAITVNGLVADLNASTSTGAITVNAVADVNITTGSAATSISETTGFTATVNAAALADDITLSIAGAGNFTVNNLVGDLTSTANGGAISITTANVATQTIDLGSGTSGTRTVNATAIGDNRTLTLTGAGAATVTLSAGDLAAGSYTGDLTVTTGSGESSIVTGSGNDTVTMNVATGVDALNAGAGTDTLVLTGSSNGNVTVDLQVSGGDQLTSNDDSGLVQQNFENVDASAMTGGALIATANSTGSRIIGSNTGNDTLNSGSGADTLQGGGGDDTVVFDATTDLAGDSIDGGAGTDAIRLDAGGGGTYDFTTAGVSISKVETLAINANEAFTIKLSDNFNSNTGDVEVVNTSGSAINSAISIDASALDDGVGGTAALNVSATNFDGADTFIGTSNGDTINGGGGNDTITGNGGADSLNAGDGADTLKFTRGQLAGVSSVVGGGGNGHRSAQNSTALL